MRITLKDLHHVDERRVVAWLPEAVAAVQGRGMPIASDLSLAALQAAWDEQYPPGRMLVGVLPEDGEPVGLARVRDAARGRLVIDALTVRSEARNLGYGQEIVFALEERFAAAGSIAAAGVPRTNGLAIYFWLRAGYHPLYPYTPDTPAGLDPALLWMVRRR